MKKIFMFVVVCALMFQLAACSTKESPNAAGSSGAPNTESAGKGGSEKVNLRYSWWGSEDRHTAILAAIDAYEKALALDPDYDLAMFNLGGAHWNSGEKIEALAIWTTAIDRFPDHELAAKLRRDMPEHGW